MKVRYLAQQHENLQLGPLLLEALSNEAGKPTRVVIVSAFASRGTISRFKKVLSDLSEGGTDVSVVVGVDMGGTSKEVLEELAKWPVKVFVFKNRRAGVTFHPKIYLIECATTADITV